MLDITCPQSALHEAVQTVARGVTGRSTQPVQNNIYLESAADSLRLVATDLEFISLEAALPVTVNGEGALTAPARFLTELVGSLPEQDVTLVADENQALAVHCEAVDYTIRGLAASDFQMFPDIGDGIGVTIPQSLLRSILRQTAFSTSRDETRPILTGALFEFSRDSLLVVATDTYRLALRKAHVELPIEQPVSAIVSSRALNELLRVLADDSEEMANVAVSANQIEFQVGNVKVASRLIEGQFPNYQKVVPESHERRVVVDVSELEPALRRALIVAREDANRVVLKPSSDNLQITAESQDVGSIDEQVPAKFEGESTEIAFNARYMLEVLDTLEAERLTLDLSGPLNPGMIRPEGDEDYLYVLMPMQIM